MRLETQMAWRKMNEKSYEKRKKEKKEKKKERKEMDERSAKK